MKNVGMLARDGGLVNAAKTLFAGPRYDDILDPSGTSASQPREHQQEVW
jgi:hypothetical protein